MTARQTPTSRVRVRGNASAEELAAVLAVVSRPRARGIDRYAQWRTTRLVALRRDQPGVRSH